MASARDTREWVLAQLVEALPEVTWEDAVLDYRNPTDKTVGGIFTRNEVQNDNDQSIVWQVVVQVGLANVVKPTPLKPNVVRQGDLEDLAYAVSDVMRVSNDTGTGKPSGYWFVRFVRTDYGYDNQGQLTRAEVTFNALGQSDW